MEDERFKVQTYFRQNLGCFSYCTLMIHEEKKQSEKNRVTESDAQRQIEKKTERKRQCIRQRDRQTERKMGKSTKTDE